MYKLHSENKKALTLKQIERIKMSLVMTLLFILVDFGITEVYGC